MLAEYYPILLFIIIGLAVGVAPMAAGRLLAPNKPDAAKLSPYECGFEAFEDARMKFDALLPRRHPVHPVDLRSPSCFRGGGYQRHRHVRLPRR
jgi:hypothetical protein